MRKITAKAPATTANLGPGYDVFGMALELHNEFEVVEGGEEKLVIEVEGDDGSEIPRDERNLLYRAISLCYEKAGKDIPHLGIKIKNHIPVTRGLGSSATASLAGVMIAHRLLNDAISEHECLNMAVDMEGHPDNLMAAYMGGIVINYNEDGNHHAIRIFPARPLEIALAIPETRISTSYAREILPPQYPVADVVTNLRNLALLISSLHTGRYELMKLALDDRLHQPYRAKLLPGFYEALDAARKAGAWGAALSGSGSAIIALCSHHTLEVATAMTRALAEKGIPCQYITTKISESGIHVNAE
jgi:homoserine kinase